MQMCKLLIMNNGENLRELILASESKLRFS